MYTIGIVSTKGGVGKTTLAANLGATPADFGLCVLLINMYPQACIVKLAFLFEKIVTLCCVSHAKFDNTFLSSHEPLIKSSSSTVRLPSWEYTQE